MSSLSNLAKTLERKNKPSSMFERTPLSKNFIEKFPVISVDLMPLASKEIPDQDLTLNDRFANTVIPNTRKPMSKHI